MKYSDKQIIIKAVVDTITSDSYDLVSSDWANSIDEVAGPSDGSKPKPGAKYYKAGDELTITINLKRKP